MGTGTAAAGILLERVHVLAFGTDEHVKHVHFPADLAFQDDLREVGRAGWAGNAGSDARTLEFSRVRAGRASR